MLRTRYPACRMLATAMLCLLLLLVAACGTKKPKPMVYGKPSTVQLAPIPKPSVSIQSLMRLALEDGNTGAALIGLEHLATEARPPLNEEAQFRRVQLLLLINNKQALTEAKQTLIAYPSHALVPYLHMWIAQWAEGHHDNAMVLAHTAAALAHSRVTS